jgi:precorrin-6A synthase
MRKVLIIGIGAGDPEYVTVQAINALNEADVFFIIDKGTEKEDLVRLRREICDRYVRGPYRIVEATDPERDRASASYVAAVEAWHEERAALYERMIRDELGEDGCGAFLVWGDPSLYDGTLRIIDRVLARGAVAFEHRVIPGITSVQALAARHRVPLNRIGESIEITTGRRLSEGRPADVGNSVVMLDGDCAFRSLDGEDIDIYWGAYLGTEDEILVAGPLGERADEIERTRREARERKGWIMDTYLLRRSAPE